MSGLKNRTAATVLVTTAVVMMLSAAIAAQNKVVHPRGGSRGDLAAARRGDREFHGRS
jgi:hypothetical protein